MNINAEQVSGMLRIVIPAVVVFAIGRGWLTTEQGDAFTTATVDAVAAVVTLASLVWSFFRNSESGQIKRVAAMKNVKAVQLAGPASKKLKTIPKVH